MAKQNAINRFTQDLTIDPGASGDSYVQFDINTTNEFRIGVDDDDADAFKISQGGALGANDTLVIYSTGECTKPLQPAFLAYLTSDDDNVTGNGAQYVLGTNVAFVEIFDQNSDFNTNGIFTAPVTARYYFGATIKMHDLAAGANSAYCRLITSNRTYYANQCHYGNMETAANELALSFGYITDMDAADTAQFGVYVVGLGANSVDIDGGSSEATFIGGFLAC